MEYIKGAELPDFEDNWEDNNTTIDFTGYTFTGHVYDPHKQVLWLTKTTGITGSSTNPNIRVEWDLDELDIASGEYLLYITATRNSDNKKYKKNYAIRIVDNGEATIFIPEPTLYGVPAGNSDGDILIWNATTESWEATTLGKPTDKYAISNTDDAGTYKYFGYEDKDGNWYILRKTVASNTFLYTKGTTAYSTAWTNRVSQTYSSYETTF